MSSTVPAGQRFSRKKHSAAPHSSQPPFSHLQHLVMSIHFGLSHMRGMLLASGLKLWTLPNIPWQRIIQSTKSVLLSVNLVEHKRTRGVRWKVSHNPAPKSPLFKHPQLLALEKKQANSTLRLPNVRFWCSLFGVCQAVPQDVLLQHYDRPWEVNRSLENPRSSKERILGIWTNSNKKIQYRVLQICVHISIVTEMDEVMNSSSTGGLLWYNYDTSIAVPCRGLLWWKTI